MLDFDPQSPDHTSVTFTDRTAFVRRYQKFVKEPKQLFSSLKSEQDLRLFGEAPEVLAASCQLHSPGFIHAGRGRLGERQFTGWPGEDFAINLETNMKWST